MYSKDVAIMANAWSIFIHDDRFVGEIQSQGFRTYTVDDCRAIHGPPKRIGEFGTLMEAKEFAHRYDWEADVKGCSCIPPAAD